MSFVIATKQKKTNKKVIKHTKTLSNSAELHFDNYAISYKELDLSINFLKKIENRMSRNSIELFCSHPYLPLLRVFINDGQGML